MSTEQTASAPARARPRRPKDRRWPCLRCSRTPTAAARCATLIGNGGAKQSKVSEVIVFDDGDELDVPGRLRAIHTPGHTEGHCVLYSQTEDALFVGDAINNVDIATGTPGPQVAPQIANTSTEQAYESLARIEQVEARTLYFGHGDPSTLGTHAIVAAARAKRP
jgi:glyoxylase-like metal-dependent hydrolase (beta-lactamase superfamily II)